MNLITTIAIMVCDSHTLMHDPAKCPPELHRCLRVESIPAPFPPGSPGLVMIKVLQGVEVLDFGSVIHRLGSLAPIGVLR